MLGKFQEPAPECARGLGLRFTRSLNRRVSHCCSREIGEGMISEMLRIGKILGKLGRYSRRTKNKGLRDKCFGRGLKVLLGKKEKVVEREQETWTKLKKSFFFFFRVKFFCIYRTPRHA